MSKTWIWIAGAVALVSILGGAIATGVARTVDYAVGVDAERKALNLSNFLIETLPDIENLIESGELTPGQIEKIDVAVSMGDVFRFKLFNATGDLVIISDEISAVLEQGALKDHSGKASEVIATGQHNISQHNGQEKPNRPDLYVEAYVPIANVDNTVIGVVEVYVDGTETSALFHGSFQKLAVVLIIVCAALFAAPYVAFQLQKHEGLRSRERIRYLARRDRLTGLYNRRGFDKTIERRTLANTFDANKSVTVCLNVDYFKSINDTYGAQNADGFLQHVGRCILENTGLDDIAVRLSGDEFAIILQQADLDEAKAILERIRAAVAKPVTLDGEKFSGHVSCGIHYAPGLVLTLAQRIKNADLALSQAKNSGRNTMRVYSKELEVDLLRRRKVEEAIIYGLANDKFHVHYQPLLEQKTGKCVGFEALLRLDDRDGNPITPTEFVPIAETMGTIEEMGSRVLWTAVEAATHWPDEMFVSVNLSARQFDKGTLLATVQEVLDKTGLDASRLELEVTESLLVEDTDGIGAQLTDLSGIGVSLAMDDFGTGYSSLGYLWKFKFNKIKIDRSFIEGLDYQSEKTREILDSIVMLSHRLDMTVTAEGIETAAQADLLSSLSCDYFQGFLYGKPMPESEIAAFMLSEFSNALKPNQDQQPEPQAKAN